VTEGQKILLNKRNNRRTK